MTRIGFGELIQGPIYQNHVDFQGAIRAANVGFDNNGGATSLQSVALAGMIHQDIPHHLRRYVQKVGPALPVNILHVGQLQIEFMH